MDIKAFWDAVLRQDADVIREYFHPNAWVNWNNTNEHFDVEDFIRAIEDGVPVSCTGEDGLRAVRVICGVYRSAKNGTNVDF